MLSVLAYHAGIPGLSGGFVGVDVFFVISGFLISGLLMAEVNVTGRLNFAAFYARRAVRILPPAGLVILVTAVASWAILPPLRAVSAMHDLIAAAGYFVNWRFISLQTDYMHAGDDPSPVLHFWSLAVEEQFYLVWPLVIAGCALILRRKALRYIGWATAFSVLSVGSFALSYHWTFSSDPLAYMSSPSRAWEFGTGALVAVMAQTIPPIHRWARALAGWLGLAAIAYSCTRLSDSTHFPGSAALWPVLGSACVIFAGIGTMPTARATVTRALATRFPRWIGRLSFSWYLWHWPAIVLVDAHFGTVSWPVKALVVLGSALPAWLSLKLLEDPVRSVKSLTARSANGIALGISISCVACLVALTLGSGVLDQLAHEATATPTAQKATATDPLPISGNSGAVTPSVTAAASDTPQYPATCILQAKQTVSQRCLVNKYGQYTTAPITADRIVMLGDSHSGEWFPAAQAISAATGWPIEIFNKSGCPLADIEVTNPQLGTTFTQCDVWKRSVFARLRTEPAPKLVLIATLNYYTSNEPVLDAGWASALAKLKAVGGPIVYLRDTPYPNKEIPSCISGSFSDWSKCSIPKYIAFHTDPLMSGSPGSQGLAARIDMDNYLCPQSLKSCPAVLDGVLLYRDDSHVTNTAMKLLAPLVLSQLRADGLVPKK